MQLASTITLNTVNQQPSVNCAVPGPAGELTAPQASHAAGFEGWYTKGSRVSGKKIGAER